MAKFLNLLGGHSKEDKEVLSALNMLEKHRVPVKIEIENTSIHFNTRISIKSATIIVAKPLNLKEGLSKGGTVRFKIPDSEGKEVRMEVLTPHFNLTNGNPVFLCKVPIAFAQSNMRVSLRYNTSKFTNVQLVLNEFPDSFRVVDLSTTGCKIYVPSKESKKIFAIGKNINGGKISLGNRVSVDLESIIPRNHRGMAIGCTINLTDSGPSKKYLHHLINSLEKSESERYRT